MDQAHTTKTSVKHHQTGSDMKPSREKEKEGSQRTPGDGTERDWETPSI